MLSTPLSGNEEQAASPNRQLVRLLSSALHIIFLSSLLASTCNDSVVGSLWSAVSGPLSCLGIAEAVYPPQARACWRPKRRMSTLGCRNTRQMRRWFAAWLSTAQHGGPWLVVDQAQSGSSSMLALHPATKLCAPGLHVEPCYQRCLCALAKLLGSDVQRHQGGGAGGVR